MRGRKTAEEDFHWANPCQPRRIVLCIWPADFSHRGSAANRPRSPLHPDESSCSVTTPTTTAGLSSPQRSTARRSASAGAATAERPESRQFSSTISIRSRSMRSSRLSPALGLATSVASAGRSASWRGPLSSGFEAVIAGDVPLGAGLSSSASLQASFASLLIELGVVPGRRARISPRNAATRSAWSWPRSCRRSENEFVGVGSGLLDQFSSLFGRDGCALFLNCRTLEFDRLPLGEPAPAIVVCDSQTSRRLADGMYNQRRSECERVFAAFREGRSRRRTSFCFRS